MTEKDQLMLDVAIQYLRDIRNNIPNVNSVPMKDEKFYLNMIWNNSMLALKALEELPKTTT